ncbi:MAG TPA: hypothetical protein VFI52_12775 [Gemmatimonadaceae bacterium]|nr:hypothetical protein [Gemmatimonadaceae bacterium]
MGELVETRVVGLGPNAKDQISREIGRQETHSAQLSQPALEAVACNRGLLEPGHDQADACFRSGRTRERGSDDPDLDMRGSDALPLSRDALNLRAPRNSCISRKAE